MIEDYMKNRNLTVEQFRNFPVQEIFQKVLVMWTLPLQKGFCINLDI